MGIAIGRDAESKSCWVSRSNSRNGSVRINIAITPPLSMRSALPSDCSATSMCSLWYFDCQVQQTCRRVVKIGAGRMDTADSERARDRGVYTISVAAELSGIEPHTLRSYERAGLLTPARSHGGDPRYSDDDLSRLRHISSMGLPSLNLAGLPPGLQLEGEKP